MPKSIYTAVSVTILWNFNQLSSHLYPVSETWFLSPRGLPSHSKVTYTGTTLLQKVPGAQLQAQKQRGELPPAAECTLSPGCCPQPCRAAWLQMPDPRLGSENCPLGKAIHTTPWDFCSHLCRIRTVQCVTYYPAHELMAQIPEGAKIRSRAHFG